jgi:hypothetical protein
MKKPKRQITVYLTDADYRRLIHVARLNGRSLSGHIKYMMEVPDWPDKPVEDTVVSSLTAIQIAVDLLVKNHPNTKLFEVVTAVRADRLKRASHEA